MNVSVACIPRLGHGIGNWVRRLIFPLSFAREEAEKFEFVDYHHAPVWPCGDHAKGRRIAVPTTPSYSKSVGDKHDRSGRTVGSRRLWVWRIGVLPSRSEMGIDFPRS